jgi:hypothetical protein
MVIKNYSNQILLNMFATMIKECHYNPTGENTTFPCSLYECEDEIMRRMKEGNNEEQPPAQE